MIRILSFLVLLVLQDVNAQTPCAPDPVKNLNLNTSYILKWEHSTNCDDVVYIVYIHYDADDLQYMYFTRNDYLNVDYLPACERYLFQVSAASLDLELSDTVSLVTYIPATADVDLSITSFTASVQAENTTFLSWHVTEQYAHCARAFRLVIRDPFIPSLRDIYTDRNNMFLPGLIPCGQYEFGIRAIYNLEEEGPISLLNYTAPQEVAPLPVLDRVNQSSTWVNISWSLPPYSLNRCTITHLDVEGLPFLHRQFPIYDIPERPLFTTSLDDLQPDNLYMLRVSIINSAGTSPTLQIGVQTLPTGGG